MVPMVCYVLFCELWSDNQEVNLRGTLVVVGDAVVVAVAGLLVAI